MMRIRLIDAALAVATLAGAILAVTSASKLHALQQEHTRLSRTTGDLDIADPGEVHVVALETGEPLHFAWRVYAPAGQMMVSTFGDGGSGTSTGFNSQPHEFIGRIRFSKHRTGQIAVYYNFGNGAGFQTAGSPASYQFLNEHLDELRIEQLGVHGTARVKQGEPVTVLKMHLPESVIAQARPRSSDHNPPDLESDLFELRLELNP